jgi:hypothetical protein
MPKLTRAGDLLSRLHRTESLSLDVIATHTGVPASSLRECVEGHGRLSIDAQLTLAAFTLEHAPALARHAHALRGQAETAKRVQAGEVVGHMISRPTWTV